MVAPRAHHTAAKAEHHTAGRRLAQLRLQFVQRVVIHNGISLGADGFLGHAHHHICDVDGGRAGQSGVDGAAFDEGFGHQRRLLRVGTLHNHPHVESPQSGADRRASHTAAVQFTGDSGREVVDGDVLLPAHGFVDVHPARAQRGQQPVQGVDLFVGTVEGRHRIKNPVVASRRHQHPAWTHQIGADFGGDQLHIFLLLDFFSFFGHCASRFCFALLLRRGRRRGGSRLSCAIPHHCAGRQQQDNQHTCHCNR